MRRLLVLFEPFVMALLGTVLLASLFAAAALMTSPAPSDPVAQTRQGTLAGATADGGGYPVMSVLGH